MQETQDTQVQSLGREDPLEEMAVHSSFLAWEIPWTEGPGRPQSVGLQRVRPDLATRPQWGFPGGASGKDHVFQQKKWETWVWPLSWEDSPGGGHGDPLQCSWLGNPMDRGAWWATVHRVTKSWTRLKWLLTCAHSKPFLRSAFAPQLPPCCPPRTSVMQCGWGAWASSLLLLSVQEPLYFCREIRTLFTERSHSISGCLPFILWSGDHFLSFERKAECRVLRGIRSEATPVFGPGEFHGLYSPWVTKSRTRLSNFHFHFSLSCPWRRVGMKMISWGWTEVFNLTIWSNPNDTSLETEVWSVACSHGIWTRKLVAYEFVWTSLAFSGQDSVLLVKGARLQPLTA